MLLPKKNDELLKNLLNQKEGQTIDFKQSITSTQKLAKSMAAFANTEGGVLIIGVSDTKKVIGIDPDEEIFMVEKAVFEFCEPKPNYSFEVLETIELTEKKIEIEKFVLLVKVEKSTKRILVKNKNSEMIFYRRLFDKTIPDSSFFDPNLPPKGS